MKEMQRNVWGEGLRVDMNALRTETVTIDENTNPQIQETAESKQGEQLYKDPLLDTSVQVDEDWEGWEAGRF